MCQLAFPVADFSFFGRVVSVEARVAAGLMVQRCKVIIFVGKKGRRGWKKRGVAEGWLRQELFFGGRPFPLAGK